MSVLCCGGRVWEEDGDGGRGEEEREVGGFYFQE